MNVYKECVQTGGGGKPTAGGGGPSGSSAGAKSSIPSSSPVAKALHHAGKDASVLRSLLKGNGLRRTLAAGHGSVSEAPPSAVGSAFDLGSGPTVLLIALGGTAVLLLGGTGMRFWRARHRV